MGDFLVTTEILLAVCNGERFLPALLDSLRKQTVSGFSVLFQDDGSGDRSPDILRALSEADPRFHSGACSGQKLGAMGNFFSLIRQSRADALLLCDQDDIWEPDKVSRLCSALAQAEQKWGADAPLLIHSDCRVIDENGQMIHESFFRHQGWDPGAVTLPRLLVQNNVTGCTLIMNRALADLVSAHADPEKLFMHDWFIALTAAAFGHVIFLDQVLTQYRQHGGNAIGASTKNQLRRGLDSLSRQERVRARLQLNYSHTRAFTEAYGDLLPESARRITESFLRTETMPRVRRVLTVQRMGCTMQSPAARLGQMIFG